jgi:CCR4-NOT transcription complex subunit 6
MSPEDAASGKRSNWSELEINGNVRNLSASIFDHIHLTHLYINDNSLTKLPADIGRLVNLQTLDATNNKLRSLPPEIGDLSRLREFLLTNNYLRSFPFEMGKLFNLQILNIKGNPLPAELLSLQAEVNGTSKLLTYLLDSLTTPTPDPPPRSWLPLATPTRTRPACIFTVLCYNVLCEKYATRQMYGYCPTWALDWTFRRRAILAELKHYAADIISLQEVETDQFHNFFLPELQADGYAGIFAAKSRAKTMSESDRKYVDGCAIFFRTSKFKLIKDHLLEFNQLAMANAEGSDDMLNRVMTKDNIGLAALLETRDAAWDNGIPVENPPLLVCTAHIHWDPEYCDVKLVQTMMLMHELRLIAEGAELGMSNAGSAEKVHLLLCGDFNSLPDSGVVEFLQTSRISAKHPDFKDLGYKQCLQRISCHTDRTAEYTHAFRLATAYSTDVMPFTNYTFEFRGVIDYIFYSRSSMSPLGLLGPMDPTWLTENKVVGAPHPAIPSDHFPLLVELEMTSGNDGRTHRR